MAKSIKTSSTTKKNKFIMKKIHVIRGKNSKTDWVYWDVAFLTNLKRAQKLVFEWNTNSNGRPFYYVWTEEVNRH